MREDMPSVLTGSDWGGIPMEQEEPVTVVLVRHGQAERKPGDGPLGPGLTKLGQRQAARVGKRLAKDRIDYIYCSDLARASETADYIKAFHGKVPSAVTAAVREVTAYHFTPCDAPEDRLAREAITMEHDTLIRFANQLRHKHAPGETVVVVAHGNFIRTILPILGGRDPRESLIMEIYNTAVSVVELWSSGDAILRLGNCVKHLLPSQVT